MIERKRRRFEIDWEGAPEDLRSRVLASDNYATARCRLILIRAIRRDLPLKFKQLLELQMKIKYEEYDDATTYLHEVMMDDRDFILKVIELIADEYKQRGMQYIEGFRCLFQNYKLDQEVALFRRAADCNPKRTSEILLALQAMRPEAFNTVSVFLMDALRKGSEPPHGLATFGNSLMAINFGNLMPDDILFICDSILKSGVSEFLTNVIGDSKDTKKKCDRNANRFIIATYPFFSAVTVKLGLPIFGAKIERSGVLLDRIVSSLPSKWSPPVIRVVAYALVICLLKMPALGTNSYILPWLSTFHRSSVDFSREQKLVHNKTFIGHNVLLALSTLFSKLSPLSSEFTQVANLIGPSEVYRLVGLSYIYSRQYSMCIGYCTTILESTQPVDIRIQAMLIASQYQLGDRIDAVEGCLGLLDTVVANEWFDLDPLISEGDAGMVNAFWFIKTSSTGQWLLNVMTNLLRSYLDEIDEDIIIAALIVNSQVEFSSGGFAVLNYALEKIQKKDAFIFPNLLGFITHFAVLERLTCFVYEKDEKFIIDDSQEARKGLSTRNSSSSQWGKVTSSLLNHSSKMSSNTNHLKNATDFLVKYSKDIFLVLTK